jgi:4-diphosphocytidyl-2-C-methyl-D-erythritol kinase
MPELRVSAPAKINLHLEVLGMRPDGYHELAMVMQSLDLSDTLRLIPSADGRIQLGCDRSDLPTDSDNLVVRAAEGMRDRVGLPDLGASIHLEKRIPIGAGLAGGSSDAAAALVGLNALWGLDLGADQLHDLAAELGSDVPFCLEGGTRLCFGRGEIQEAVALAKPPELGVLLVKSPAVTVSTPWAYGRFRQMRGDFYLEREADFEQRREALRRGPLIEALRGEAPWPPIRNDLQTVVAPEVESVGQGLALLKRADGALAVAMSGSGPSLFALFPHHDHAVAARAALGERLREAGLEAWCCTCRHRGVELMA